MAFQNLSLTIVGMTCQGCVKSVKNAILTLEGIQSCEVDFVNHQADIVYDDTLVQSEAITNVVEEAGFDIK